MPSLQQTQRLIQHLSPQQILQSSVLQLNSLMIEARILEELEQNPALELDEEELAPDGDEQSESEEDDADEDEEAETEAEIDWDELLNSPEDYNVARIEDHSKEDIELQIPASEVFVEKLSQQLVDLELSEKDLKIADEILGNVNNEGYLVVDPVLVADRMKVSGDRVEQVRRQVMQLNPPGIGALDLQECLLAQLDFAGGSSLARRMIADHFADFANRRYNRVLQALGGLGQVHTVESGHARIALHAHIHDVGRQVVVQSTVQHFQEFWRLPHNRGGRPQPVLQRCVIPANVAAHVQVACLAHGIVFQGLEVIEQVQLPAQE